QGLQDSGPPPAQPPDKVGWIRKFCGRGIFRELWRNRFMVLRGEQLYISEKEVKDERKAQEVFHLADYERCEELRKAGSRSKKNHSRFVLLRRKRPANTVPHLLFLAVSPEEKESWISALNVAITRAKNRAFDERMQRAQELLEEMRLQELQEARAEREPPLRGLDSPRLHHLRGPDSAHSRSAGSPRSRSSDSPRLRGPESPRSRAKRTRSRGTDSPRSRGSSSPATRTKDSPQPKDLLQLPAGAGSSPGPQGPGGCLGPDPEAPCPPPEPKSQGSDSAQVQPGRDLLQNPETCGSGPGSPGLRQKVCPSPPGSVGSSDSRAPEQPRGSPPSPALLLTEGDLDVASQRAEAERLLEEAVSSWREAQEVLQEVKELQSQTLRRQRRRTYEKMIPAPAGTDQSDTVAPPASPEEDESETA
ncbi:unnamed protein product, partial [Tetraodon nigroviridis]